MEYTCKGGESWMVEWWSVMEKEVRMGSGGYGFSINLTPNNPNKRL